MKKEKDIELENPIIKLQKEKELKLHLGNFGNSIPEFLAEKTLIIKGEEYYIDSKEGIKKVDKPDLLK